MTTATTTASRLPSTLSRPRREGRWSDYLPFIPVMLCVAVVFVLPAAGDRQSVAEVQAWMSSALHAVVSLGGGDIPVAAPPRGAAMPVSQQVQLAASRRASQAAPGQQWENRPRTMDHTAGRATRLSYGAVNREGLAGARR